jgi:glycosyltransferase involved in cell wall biosynthesis
MFNTIDWFVSNTNGTRVLWSDYGIPIERCIEIMYHTSDFEKLVSTEYNSRAGLPAEAIARLGGLATLSEDVVKMAQIHSHRVPKPVKLLKIGYNSHAFYGTPSLALNTLGFGGGYHSREETQNGIVAGNREPWVFKRGYLARESAEQAGINFSIAQQYSTTNMTMPAWYSVVDAISCPGLDQGAGGPVYEGGLAGKLIFTTNAGEFASCITQHGADVVPSDEQGFVEESVRLIHYYRANPLNYRERCYSIRDWAIKKYDWQNYVPQWLELFKQ